MKDRLNNLFKHPIKKVYFFSIIAVYLLIAISNFSISFYNFLALGQEIKEINTQIGYTLTYNNQDGEGCTIKVQHSNQVWGELCIPTKSGMQFQGWYTGTNGTGTEVTSSTTAASSITVYAKWGYPMLITQDNQTTNIFGHTFAKEDIEIINIVNNQNIPNNAENWDVSNDRDRSIMAWVIDSDSNGKYELYIGTNYNKILANSNSRTTFALFANAIAINGLTKLDTSSATTMSSMFYGCENITSLDVSNFDTTNVTNMYCMFYKNYKLQSLDLSSFNTSNVTIMQGMFNRCWELVSLDISSFDTSNVETMRGMFMGAHLSSIDVSHFNTSKVTDMYGMFGSSNPDEVNQQMQWTTIIGLENFDTSKVTDMMMMFQGSPYLTSLNLSSFDTSNVKTMRNMFLDCDSLTTLDLTTFDTSKVENMYKMFKDCDNLKTIYVDPSKWNTSAVTDSTEMFLYSTNLIGSNGTVYDSNHIDVTYAHVDVAGNPGYLSVRPVLMVQTTNATTDFFGYTFDKESVETVSLVTSINIPNGALNWDVSEAQNESIMAWATDTDSNGKYELYIGTNGNKIYANPNSRGAFNGYKNATAINGLDKFDTTLVTNMSWMFQLCQSVTSLDISHFDTSNVTDMSGMFNFCESLLSLNLSNFVTNKVNSMERMFNRCQGLTALNLSNFNTANVENMYCMFHYCIALTNLNISSFNTSKVNNMRQMFNGCSSLTSLNLRNFNTSITTDMYHMFSYCDNLVSVDLSSFNTSLVTVMEGMFAECPHLTTIIVDSSKWSVTAVTNSTDMFLNSTSLVGGNGTIYDSNHIDKTYAHVDVASNPGYLTEKTN